MGHHPANAAAASVWGNGAVTPFDFKMRTEEVQAMCWPGWHTKTQLPWSFPFYCWEKQQNSRIDMEHWLRWIACWRHMQLVQRDQETQVRQCRKMHLAE